MSNLLYLNDQQLGELGISADEIVTAIESTLSGIRENQVYVAPKSGVTTSDGRYVMSTLSTTDIDGMVAVKSVVFNPHKEDKNLPSIDGGFMLLDSNTGKLQAVLDANWITAVRTAGLSLVAAKRLANPQSQSIGLIGAGAQAESHLRMFNQHFPLKSVRLTGRSAQGIKRMEGVAKELQLDFEQVDPQTCIQLSDVIVSAVTRDPAIEPFLDAGLLSPGSFVAIPDLAIPWHPNTLSNFGRIFIDDLGQEKSMENKIVDLEMVNGDLLDLTRETSSYDDSISSAFVFRGIAAGDLALAALAYKRSQVL